MVKSRAVILMMCLALAACSSDKGIRHLTNDGEGPDEFKILPAKPLSAPKNYKDLPAPAPGGKNLTAADPLGDAVAALGGRASAVVAVPGQIGAGDQGLVSHTNRYGANGTIRAVLAEEDADLRRRRGRFTNIRLVKTDRYNDVYKKHQLDAYAELARWRKAGAKTPAVPPSE